MITTEVFVLLKLFVVNNQVNWWWIVFFLVCDGMSGYSLRKLARGVRS